MKYALEIFSGKKVELGWGALGHEKIVELPGNGAFPDV